MVLGSVTQVYERNKVIVRIRGGLGNQMFCYASAYALAHSNCAELVVDNVSGFAQDWKYQRVYSLDGFNISARTCSTGERFEPFSRIRRYIIRQYSRGLPYERRRYLQEEEQGFDSKLMSYRVCGQVYLDGYWQSYLYFHKYTASIRHEFEISVNPSVEVLRVAREITSCNSVAVHFRGFDNHGNERRYHTPNAVYYREAINRLHRLTACPRFFVFSDDLAQAKEQFATLDVPVTYVNTQNERASELLDLWLMTLCRNYIIANSTFSWWAAWLNERSDKIVLAPKLMCSGVGAWGFDGLLPNDWLIV